MAVFTRVNGTSQGVVHVDIADRPTQDSTGIIISTGIGKHPTMYKIEANSSTLSDQLGTGGAVETILRVIATNAVVIAYQVEGSETDQMRVLVEATSWNDGSGDYDLQAAIRAIGTAGVDPVISLAHANVTEVGFKS
jgi:hypothetical protein